VFFEADFRADRQMLEFRIQETISMKIDQSAIRCQDSTKALVEMKFCNCAVGRRLVRLHIPPPDSDVVLQLARGGINGVTDSHINVLVAVIPTRITINDDFGAWNVQIDTNVIDIAFDVMPVRCRNRHPATQYVRRESLEPFAALSGSRLDELGSLDIPKLNFDCKTQMNCPSMSDK
jgi:hypothetical protein